MRIHLGKCRDLEAFQAAWKQLGEVEEVKKAYTRIEKNLFQSPVLEVTASLVGRVKDLPEQTFLKARLLLLRNNPLFAKESQLALEYHAPLLIALVESPPLSLSFRYEEEREDPAQRLTSLHAAEIVFIQTSEGETHLVSKVFLPAYFDRIVSSPDAPFFVNFSRSTILLFLKLQQGIIPFEKISLPLSEYLELLNFVELIIAEKTAMALRNALQGAFCQKNRTSLLFRLFPFLSTMLMDTPGREFLIYLFQKEFHQADRTTQNIIRKDLKAADKEILLDRFPPGKRLKEELPPELEKLRSADIMEQYRRRKHLETGLQTEETQYHLALLYAEGLGCKKNEVKALHTLKMLGKNVDAFPRLHKIDIGEKLEKLRKSPWDVVLVKAKDTQKEFPIHRSFLPNHPDFKGVVEEEETLQLFLDWSQGKGIPADLPIEQLVLGYAFANRYELRELLAAFSDLIQKLSAVIPRDHLLPLLFDSFLLGQKPSLVEAGIVSWMSQELPLANPETQKAFVRKISPLAERGDPTAQNALGWCYSNGIGVMKDLEKTFHHQTQSAAQGNALATANLGSLYSEESFLKYDIKKAFACYKQAADQGLSIGESSIGFYLMTGRGVKRDEAAGVSFLKKAVDQGQAIACIRLGDCYLYGLGVEKDLEKAFSLYMEAFRKQPEIAWCSLGCFCLKARGYTKLGLFYLKEAEENGDEEARCLLFRIYAEGIFGIPKDPNEACHYALRGEEQGIAQGQYDLALCCEKGWGIEANLEQALSYYRRADKQGHDEAKFAVARFYKEGLAGLANPQLVKQYAEYFFNKGESLKDMTQAFPHYLKAADLGMAEAQLRVGMLYFTGEGIKADVTLAKAFLERAAAQGTAEAQKALDDLF